MKNKYMVIGNVVRELGFSPFGIGEARWKWRKKYFSGFRVEPHRWLNSHMIIVGGSGGGKSNACKMIVESLCEAGAKVAILDPHNEYLGISAGISAEVYDAARNGINMFDLDGVSERERGSEITGMLKRNFRLGEVQGYMLYKCIMYAYYKGLEQGHTPNIHSLMFTIKAFKRNAKLASERGVLESLERRLALIENGAFERSTDMGRVISGNSVFLLSGLHTPEAQSIYIEGFLRKIYSKMLGSEKSVAPKFYVVIDEAEKLGDNPIIGRIAAEGRKYGIGIIAVSQRAKLIDKDLRGNACMLAAFGIKEPEELNYVANFIAGGNEMGRFAEVKKALRNAGRGCAVVIGAGMRNPVVVRFKVNTSSKENVEFRISELSRGGIRKGELVGRIGGCSVDGSIEKMLGSGRMKSCSIVCGKYSGLWYISDSHNSAEHDVAVNIISKHLLSLGIRNRMYNSSYGPDIIAFGNGTRVAVEYETGSKSIDDTARMLEGRKAKYQKVIVVVNDAHYEEYSKRFGDVIALSALETADFHRFMFGPDAHL